MEDILWQKQRKKAKQKKPKKVKRKRKQRKRRNNRCSYSFINGGYSLIQNHPSTTRNTIFSFFLTNFNIIFPCNFKEGK